MLFVAQILQLIVVMMLLMQLIYTLYCRGIVISVGWCAYYVFCFFFVLPELVLMIHGELEIRSYGYQFIKNNWQVDILYALFIVVTTMLLRNNALRSIGNESLRVKRVLSIHIPQVIAFLAFGLTLIPTVLAITAPQPELYFSSFAAFHRKNAYRVSASASAWHSGIMSNGLKISMVAVLLLWLYFYNCKDKKLCIIGRSYVWIIACQVLLFSSKRTLGTVLFLALVMIDVLYKKKNVWFEIVFVLLFVVGYFILYQSVVQKTVGGGSSAAVEMYIVYFSRVLDLKYVLYSLLNPEIVKILEYPFQSFLYDILFFIPRAVWVKKPYPYGVHYTAAWNNQVIQSVTSRYTVSWFSEAVANLSWIGMPAGIWLYLRMLRCFEKFKNPLVYVFSIYMSSYFMITHVQSNFFNIFVLIALYVVVERRIKESEQK